MQEKHLFEYAVLRVVPRVEREEFINVGIILYCKKQKYLKAKFFLNDAKLKAFCPDTDCIELKEYLSVIENICLGDPAGGPIARLDMPTRFRWLTATRSTVVQSSKVHPGLTDDLDGTLERLHAQLVL
ncbi:DUF3037 domain-containing protein [Chitinophaga sedimenti]|uniref:DUF3037 domain-containing protein n=1 Tax=Chitinophaga sedimenti TaxID=2033606 RepID=UPI002004D234|nr:DUF3037 domain-containing protein [Chitinophaga sedimenti]MCK7554430.1 DUF3037 domain-containing protein [Chitinophaga sedimenti]